MRYHHSHPISKNSMRRLIAMGLNLETIKLKIPVCWADNKNLQRCNMAATNIKAAFRCDIQHWLFECKIEIYTLINYREEVRI